MEPRYIDIICGVSIVAANGTLTRVLGCVSPLSYGHMLSEWRNGCFSGINNSSFMQNKLQNNFSIKIDFNHELQIIARLAQAGEHETLNLREWEFPTCKKKNDTI